MAHPSPRLLVPTLLLTALAVSGCPAEPAGTTPRGRVTATVTSTAPRPPGQIVTIGAWCAWPDTHGYSPTGDVAVCRMYGSGRSARWELVDAARGL